MSKPERRESPQAKVGSGRSLDILGLGIVAVDDLLFVEGFPTADSKTPVVKKERQGGGLTATALVAAARLGARCAYAGMLGDNDLSRFVEETFLEEGVDVSHRVHVENASPVHSIIVVDRKQKTRSIFFDLPETAGAHPLLPAPEVIQSARVLLVDHWGVEGMIRASRIAREAGIPVVADLERDPDPRFRELLSMTDHPILARDFALRVTGEPTSRDAVTALARGKTAAVVTLGREGCLFASGKEPGNVRHQAAFEVDTVDTTGCGDVFHGAYALALARGEDLPSRVHFATGAAAMKATRAGGQAGAPAAEALDAFLKGARAPPATPG